MNQFSIGKFEVGELYRDTTGDYVLCCKKEYDKRNGGAWEFYFLCGERRMKKVSIGSSSVITQYGNSIDDFD
jgi:hypothetical protein